MALGPVSSVLASLRGSLPESTTLGNKRGSVQCLKDLIHLTAWRSLYYIVWYALALGN